MDRYLGRHPWMYPVIAGIAIVLALALAVWLLAGHSRPHPARGATAFAIETTLSHPSA